MFGRYLMESNKQPLRNSDKEASGDHWIEWGNTYLEVNMIYDIED